MTDREEGPLAAGMGIMFGDDFDLTKLTETPPKMIMALVRTRVIEAALDPDRRVSLLEVFTQEFDRRMISRDRKGRIEAVQMIQGVLAAEQDEEEGVM